MVRLGLDVGVQRVVGGRPDDLFGGDLRSLAGRAELQRLGVVGRQVGGHRRRLGAGRGAGGLEVRERVVGRLVEVVVLQRRLPEDDVAGAARRAVPVDDRELRAGEVAGVRRRVADGRRRQHELRVGVVVRQQPAQPPEDERHVRPRDAAELVGLVDDDQFEVRVEAVPAAVSVVSREVDVQPGRVRQDDVRLPADAPLPVLVGVAVVDADRRVDVPVVPELVVQRPLLVAGQRLHREQTQCGAFGVRQVVPRHLQRVDPRLPRRRRRRDDDVVAVGQPPEPRRLVREQLPVHPVGQRRSQHFVGRHRRRLPRRDALGVTDLVPVVGVAVLQRLPAQHLVGDGAAAIVAAVGQQPAAGRRLVGRRLDTVAPGRRRVGTVVWSHRHEKSESAPCVPAAPSPVGSGW